MCIMRYMFDVPLQVDSDLDDLFKDAVKIATQYDRASSSLLQLRLDIGYTRPASILDQLEASGVVSTSDGSSAPRNVLVTSYEEFLSSRSKKIRRDDTLLGCEPNIS